LIDEVFSQHKPLLAICRGHQLINVALGGELIADIKLQVPGASNHQRLDKAGKIVHEVSLTPGSLLSKIVGKQKLGVNSSHHQAVMKAAEPLTATAFSPDGMVEAMELKPEASHLLPYFLSVQFHPERLAARDASHQAIFQSFIKACLRQIRRKL
jgi:putative glutamine amidotransferase